MQPTRRGVLAALGASATGLAAGVTALHGSDGARAAGGTWPQPGADAGNTGYAAGQGPQRATEQWRHDGGARRPPLVADGYVFPQGEGVTALDAATGERAWRAGGTPTETRSGAARATAYSRVTAVADGYVLVRGGDTLYALPTDGKRVEWSHELPGPGAAVAVADGTAHVWTGNMSQSVIIGLGVADGEQQFRYRTAPGVGLPAVADGTLYLNLEGRIAALAPGSGDERWSQTPPPAERDPRSDDEDDDAPGFARSPVVADGSVYGVDSVGRLHALDVGDGRERWRFQPPEAPPTFPGGHRTGSRPAVADGTVYAGFSDGRVRAFDAETGEVGWSFWAWNGLTGTPAVTGDTVYAGSADTMVYALDRATGERRWEFSTDAPVRGVSVAGGRAYATTERRLYALGDGGDA